VCACSRRKRNLGQNARRTARMRSRSRINARVPALALRLSLRRALRMPLSFFFLRHSGAIATRALLKNSITRVDHDIITTPPSPASHRSSCAYCSHLYSAHNRASLRNQCGAARCRSIVGRCASACARIASQNMVRAVHSEYDGKERNVLRAHSASASWTCALSASSRCFTGHGLEQRQHLHRNIAEWAAGHAQVAALTSLSK